MTTPPTSGATPADPPAPGTPRTPKRGAFPTPRSEIEAARAYVPATDPAHGPPTPDETDDRVDPADPDDPVDPEAHPT